MLAGTSYCMISCAVARSHTDVHYTCEFDLQAIKARSVPKERLVLKASQVIKAQKAIKALSVARERLALTVNARCYFALYDITGCRSQTDVHYTCEFDLQAIKARSVPRVRLVLKASLGIKAQKAIKALSVARERLALTVNARCYFSLYDITGCRSQTD